jgi:DNA-binding NtrC family response regulator
MSELRELVDRVAEATAAVLISGEIGTGKGIVARSIHARGSRGHAPFVTVNCAEVSTQAAARISLVQSLLEDARGGTLFLDEIADLTLPLQAQLLQALEGQRLDVRVIASTSQNLRELAKAGAFRADLIFRIDVVNLEVPPLRSRNEDIPELAEHFLERSRRRAPASNVERFSPDAMALMRAYAWPGNVRELEQCVEGLVVLGRGPDITSEQLPNTIVPACPPPASFHGEVVPLREIGRRYVRWAYEQSGKRKMLPAERLQIDDKTLNKMLLGEPEFSAGTTDTAK